MDGSLQVKKDMYYVAIRLEDESGKKKQKWISTGIRAIKGNKRKAEAEKVKILAEMDAQKTVYAPQIPFIEWVEKWLELKKMNVRISTYEAYRSYVDLHIGPYFKEHNVSLDKLLPRHIQEYYNLKLTGDNPLSPNSIDKHHVVIRGALQEALKNNLIAYNPADRVTLPAKQKHEGKAYDADQANVLLKTLTREPLKCAVVLGLFYGLRRSEVCGLRWQDIDFDAGTLSIRNTKVRVKTVVEAEQTKSRASKRTMLLIPETIPYLKHLKAQMCANKLQMGSAYYDADNVCAWPDGRPVDLDYVSNGFRRFLQRRGLPVIRFHELRHTAGSLLLNKGLSAKQIQEYLGHENISTTLDIYGHLSVQGKREAATTIDNVLELKVV